MKATDSAFWHCTKKMKSAGNTGSGHIYWTNPYWKTCIVKKKLFMPLMSAILTKKQNSVSNKVKLTVHSRGLPFLSASYFLYNSTFQFQFQYHKRTRYDSSNKTLLVFNTQMKVFIKIRIKSFYLLPWGTILHIT